MYDGIFLDIDDTVFDYEKCSRNALKQACDQCGVSYSEDVVLLFRNIDNALWKKQKQGLLSIEEVVRMRAELLLDKLGKLEISRKFKNCFQQGLAEEIILIPGVNETLRHLSKRVPLYAASNGMKEMQLNRLNKANLLKYFTDVYVSDDIGAEKPELLFFQECMKRSKLNNLQILMIGDSLEADMAGADNAGIDTCWYNPSQKENSIDVKLNYEITDLRELKTKVFF